MKYINDQSKPRVDGPLGNYNPVAHLNEEVIFHFDVGYN